MVKTRDNIVIGSFQDQQHALEALRTLRENDFLEDQLALVAREWVGGERPEDVERQQKAGEGAVTGAVTGAGIGSVLGVAGAAGASLIPGVGPVLLGGLITAAAGGAAFGAAAGTFVGPFLALNLTEEEARYHASEVEAGRTVLIVRTEDRQEEAQTLLRQFGAYDDSLSSN